MSEQRNPGPQRRAETVYLGVLVLFVFALFLVSLQGPFFVEAGVPHSLQLLALALGIIASILLFFYDWQEHQKIRWLPGAAALLTTLVPVILVIGTYLEKKETQRDHEDLIDRHERLLRKQTELFDKTLGGSSWPYVGLTAVRRASTNRLRWQLKNCGTNPLYDVNLRIVDHAKMLDVDGIQQVRWPDQDSIIEANTRRFAFGTVRPLGVERILFDYQSIRSTGHVWRLELTARNGEWRQWIGLTINGDDWTVTNTADTAEREFRKGMGIP